jgi:hypothetical protein
MPNENLVKALIKAQLEMPAIDRDGEANAGRFSYDYITLGNLISVSQPVLANNGLTISQVVTGTEDGTRIGVRTLLMHESGEHIESTVYLPLLMEGNYLQEAGKIITYLRRYSYSSILGVHSETDDDGTGVGGTQQATTTTKKPTSTKKPTKKAESTSNGRPYTPEQLMEKLDITKQKVTPVSKSQVGLVAGMLKRYCEGDDDLRHRLQAELTGGFASLSDADPKMVHAIVRWLDPQKDSGGEYFLPDVVNKELDAIVREMPETPAF